MDFWQLIKSKGFSVHALAEITGIPENTLYGYTSRGGEPKSIHLVKLAFVLNVDAIVVLDAIMATAGKIDYLDDFFERIEKYVG